MSGISVSRDPPDLSSTGLFEQGFLCRCNVPTHLLSHAGLSETFRCNLCHVTAIRNEHSVLFFANRTGWTIPPMGNKCSPRNGSVFLDLPPNINQLVVHDPLGVTTSTNTGQ